MTAIATLGKRELVQELIARRELAETSWLDLCEAAAQVIAQEAWTIVGYTDAVLFFEDYARMSYRGLRRSLTIFEGLQALPEADREEAKDALVDIGRHKAEILVPLLKDPTANWREWAQKAVRLTEDALRGEVNAVTGNGRAPVADKPGDKLYRWLLLQMPEDARPEVERVFALGRKITGSDNSVNVLLSMFREVAVEWEHRAAEKYR